MTNPLLGPSGRGRDLRAAEGRDARATSRELDGGLGRYADALEAATGRRERDTPGAGAAGGTGFGLLCLADRFALARARARASRS